MRKRPTQADRAIPIDASVANEDAVTGNKMMKE